jgi:glycosyltransferase involved in cell wall biosynthesis
VIDKVWGVTMVKDEVDVIEGVLRHMAGEVDRILVADNGSRDGTRRIIDDLARELALTVLDDPVVAYFQSQKMTHLANLAHGAGAEWVVPFDADEIWYHPDAPLRNTLQEVRADVVDVRLINHWVTTEDDQSTNDPFQRHVWREALPQELGKVAVRWQHGMTIMQGNHGVRMPEDQIVSVQDAGVRIRHFPYRSTRQFISKARNGAAAYAAAEDEIPADQGDHWRRYGEVLERDGEAGIVEIFERHFFYPNPAVAGMVRDPAPYRRWG